MRKLDIHDFAIWDWAYVTQKLCEEKFAFSEKEVREYFPLPAVWDGLNAILRRLFGIALVERTGVDVWHPDVRFFDVREGEKLIGGLYVDLYARKGKKGGAWMDMLVGRKKGGENLQLPIGLLSCNFDPPGKDTPTLLTSGEARTLFHEFGHNQHHLLGVSDTISGSMEDVEWDAIELPSQLFEKWALHKETIPLVSRHYRTGKPLPEAITEKIEASRTFGTGLLYVRHFEFSLSDMLLFKEYDPRNGARATETFRDVRRRYGILPHPDYDRTMNSFEHIFADSYAAGYYSYFAADVMVADCFERFEREGIFNTKTATDYRREILAVGSSRPFQESFEAFRGRALDPEAFFREKGF